MIYEFALDPVSINNWQACRYVIEQCGVEHGRIISRFPKKWKKLVYIACSECSTIELKRIEEKLSSLGNKIFGFCRSYDNEKTWLENAKHQHIKNPFRAIISTVNDNNNEILNVYDLNEGNPYWKTKREAAIPRNAESLAKCASMLLIMSNEILFVDPHFKPTQPRFTNNLKKMLCYAVHGKTPKRIELHVKDKDESNDFWNNICKRTLQQIIPQEHSLTIIRWNEMNCGERLHPRYVLTNLGGIRYEVGLDEQNYGEGQTTDVSLLDIDLYKQRWDNYQKETTTFEFLDEIIISNKYK